MMTGRYNSGGVAKHLHDLDNLPSENGEAEKQEIVQSVVGWSAGERVKKIDPRIRALLHHNRHLPMVS